MNVIIKRVKSKYYAVYETPYVNLRLEYVYTTIKFVYTPNFKFLEITLLLIRSEILIRSKVSPPPFYTIPLCMQNNMLARFNDNKSIYEYFKK